MARAKDVGMQFALTVAVLAGAPGLAWYARAELPVRMGALVFGIGLGWLWALGRFVARAPGFARRAAHARAGSAVLALCLALVLGGGGAFAWHALDMRGCRAGAAELLAAARDDAWRAAADAQSRRCARVGLDDDAARLEAAMSQAGRAPASASVAPPRLGTSATRAAPTALGTSRDAGVDGAGAGDAGAGDAGAADAGAALVDRLVAIVRDPGAAAPSSVTRTVPGEVDYHYEVAPLRQVILTVYAGAPGRWRLDLRTLNDIAPALAPEAARTRLCERGVAVWYGLESGPFADAFLSVGRPDFAGVLPIAVVSRAQVVAEKARKEEGRAFRAASLRDHLCED